MAAVLRSTNSNLSVALITFVRKPRWRGCQCPRGCAHGPSAPQPYLELLAEQVDAVSNRDRVRDLVLGIFLLAVFNSLDDSRAVDPTLQRRKVSGTINLVTMRDPDCEKQPTPAPGLRGPLAVVFCFVRICAPLRAARGS